jgi:membrane protein DedA with SNARE-associated domain
MFLVARFLVGMRSPIYLAMGVMRIEFLRFVLRDAIAAGCAVSVFFWLSYFFGAWIGPHIRQSQLAFTGVILFAACLAGLYFLVWKKIRQRLNLDELPHDHPDSKRRS